ncbi:hypothetical protein [Streptomyces yaizuensis]|uniref:Uncharacterized protein n=1 Tax=Streptomyces yaizuensis TaxID=2989713 RepID=A0ABQ5NVH4_9ACTN|nr:hypothetical protein [Streptomyces sp. YSPA8]GLF94363.1 hypothetical protein SYYSPA8_08720 [Streptomyces sp. YSPA8]
MIRSHRYLSAAAVTAAACALSLSAAGAAEAAPAAPRPSSSGEVDRNLIKPPPGGVLAPATDLLQQVGLVPMP